MHASNTRAYLRVARRSVAHAILAFATSCLLCGCGATEMHGQFRVHQPDGSYEYYSGVVSRPTTGGEDHVVILSETAPLRVLATARADSTEIRGSHVLGGAILGVIATFGAFGVAYRDADFKDTSTALLILVPVIPALGGFVGAFIGGFITRWRPLSPSEEALTDPVSTGRPVGTQELPGGSTSPELGAPPVGPPDARGRTPR